MPRYGFNFLWMFSKQQGAIQPADEKALDFLAAHGLDFVRIPSDYLFWTKDYDYTHPDESCFQHLDRYLAACRARNIHMSLNLHRAPGYCVARQELERHNLWVDAEAQDAFVFLWQTFARRYQGVPGECLSFDLLNEPPWPGKMTREVHAAVMRRVVAAIREIDPERPIVIDGVGCGKLAIPELADLGVIHSGRGYTPMSISHYQAPWAGVPDEQYPEPVWPGAASVGSDRHFRPEGGWDFDGLREVYRPWREVAVTGVEVHIGEFGCFNKTPNAVALAWLGDLLRLFKEYHWGYALWNFTGAFGIINHGRPGAKIESYKGYEVDRELFDLFLAGRVEHTSFELRAMRPGEVDQVCEADREAFLNSRYGEMTARRTMTPEELSDWQSIKDFREYCTQNPDRVMVAMVGDAVAGFGTLGFEDEPTVGKILNCAVRPVYRGMGVGVAVVKRLIHELKSRGASRVKVTTSHVPEACRMYEKAGFQQVLKRLDYGQDGKPFYTSKYELTFHIK
jgi:endoglucanase